MKTQPGTRPLRELAGLYGMQTAYYDVNGQRRTAAAEFGGQLQHPRPADVRHVLVRK
jgi:hypothetical protein